MKRSQKERKPPGRSGGDNRPVPTDARCFEALSFPDFARPTELGHISLALDEEGNQTVLKDKRQMKFLRTPSQWENVSFDLNHGYEEWVEKKSKLFLGPILNWGLEPWPEPADVKQSLQGADVVCWRGLLTRIACSPYENRDGWKLAVVRVHGVYFLAEFDTDEKIRFNLTQSDQQRRMGYWGYKFEQYLVAERAEGVPSIAAPINSLESFSVVFRGRLGSHRLLFAGEVDCLDADTGAYVELKTNRIFTARKQEENFYRFKSLKWWMQSFLVGIEHILVGFRDDDGLVRSLKSMELRDLAKDARKTWKASVCFNFLEKVLDHVRTAVTSDDPRRVYLMEWQPRQPFVSLLELEGDQAQQHSFLPHWFLQRCL